MSRPSPRDRMLNRRNTIGGPQPTSVDPAVTVVARMGRLSRQQMADLDVMFPPRMSAEPTVVAQSLGQQQVLAYLRKELSE